MHGERLMALLFFPNWVRVINEPFSWQLVASPVRGALQRQAGVWPVLQGSCYTRGGAFLSAQTDISRAAVEDAEVRGVICMTFSWALEAPSSCSLLFSRCGEGILRAQKCEWGRGIWSFFLFSSVHLWWVVSNDLFSLRNMLRYILKTLCERELLLLVLINTWALLLSLVHLAESHSSWEFSTAGEGCSQQHHSEGVKMGCFSSVCSVSLSACHASCSTCKGPLATHCTSCSFPLALHQGQCLESCGEGFYQDHNICKGKLCTWNELPSCWKPGFVFPLSYAEPVNA